MSKRKTAADLLRLYPDRVPIVVDAKDLTITKNKFLVPSGMVVNQFIQRVRNNVARLDETETLFFFAGNTIVSGSITISQIYHKHKSGDGLLYLHLAKENTFG